MPGAQCFGCFDGCAVGGVEVGAGGATPCPPELDAPDGPALVDPLPPGPDEPPLDGGALLVGGALVVGGGGATYW